MILHDYPPSGNGYEVRLLPTRLGIACRRIEYDLTRGETRTPEYLGGINPRGRVSVLEMDDREDASRVRILVDGAEVRPADLPDGFFRLARGPQAMDPDRAVG